MILRPSPAAFRALVAASAVLFLAACNEQHQDDGETGAAENAEPAAAPNANEILAAEESVIGEDGLPEGTPMAERVATLGLLNKRNNLTYDIELKPGQQRRVEDVLVRLATCERRPPWDPEPEEGAFVQVFTTDEPAEDDPEWTRIFSGWLFLNSPSLNVVEHPIYDVWIKNCAMRFPGEEEAASAAKPSGSGA